MAASRRGVGGGLGGSTAVGEGPEGDSIGAEDDRAIGIGDLTDVGSAGAEATAPFSDERAGMG
jgi:hypothetical protein